MHRDSALCPVSTHPSHFISLRLASSRQYSPDSPYSPVMGNLVPRFCSQPITPPPSASTSAAAPHTPSPETPPSERSASTSPAVGTPWRSVTPDQSRSRWPVRPSNWDSDSRPPATPPSSGSPWRRSPRPRRLFASAGSGRSDQSGVDESPTCTIPWASPAGSDGRGSPTSPWARSSDSSPPSPIYPPPGHEEGPYGRNAYFSCSPGPYMSTPQR